MISSRSNISGSSKSTGDRDTVPRPPARNENSKAVVGVSVVWQFVRLTILVPIGVVLLVFTIGFLRLRAEGDQEAEEKARVASEWLAGQLWTESADIDPGDFSRAQTGIKGLVGLFDGNGSPLSPGPLCRFDPERVRELIRARESVVTLDKKKYAIALTPFGDKPKKRYAAVALERDWESGELIRAGGRLGVVSLIIIVISAIFGVSFGRDVVEYLRYIQARFGIMADEKIPPALRNPSGDLRDEFGTLSRSTTEFENRFRGELAMYQDAMDEVDILNENRSEFLGDVAGELLGPLTNIVTMAADLLRGDMGPLEENQKEDVRIISQASHRLLNIVNEIMDLSSLISRGLAPGGDLVDLREIIAEVVETARGGIGDKNIRIVFDAGPQAGPFVRGDRQRLWQVFTNIVSNAIKFTDEGEVRVDVGHGKGSDAGRAVVVVTDTGVGIPKEDWGSIFDPFQQGGSTLKKLRGTGLGLAISKRIVELHNGEISVSAKEGNGSKFTVVFPCEGSA